MDIRSKIDEYLDFIKETGFCYKDNNMIEMITDFDKIMDYCKKTGNNIGIINRNEYNVHVIDLVRNKNNQIYEYERIVKAVQGNSVVVIPFKENKIILLKQFRHALGDYQYAFPRGFGEISLSPKENARKEIIEELNCDSKDYIFLGNIVADSGLCGEKVYVFKCSVEPPCIQEYYENIASYIEVDETELSDMIRNRLINDGFTLSALTLYNCTK